MQNQPSSAKIQNLIRELREISIRQQELISEIEKEHNIQAPHSNPDLNPGLDTTQIKEGDQVVMINQYKGQNGLKGKVISITRGSYTLHTSQGIIVKRKQKVHKV